MAIKKIIKKKPLNTRITRKLNITPQNRQRIQEIRNRYKKGVTIRDALSLSLQSDGDKAKKEIKIAKLTARKKTQLIFTTNASGKHRDYKYMRIRGDGKAETHTVTIEFTEVPTSKTLHTTPFKYQCSCGQHSHRYRYIWTLLNSSLGFQEHRFPSIRNYKMRGMFCKHGIKTMQYIQTPIFKLRFDKLHKKLSSFYENLP